MLSDAVSLGADQKGSFGSVGNYETMSLLDIVKPIGPNLLRSSFKHFSTRVRTSAMMQVLLCVFLCLAATTTTTATNQLPDREVERSTAVATDCTVTRNGDSRCKLVFDRHVTSATKSLQLTVRDRGRIVTCTRGMQNDNDENKWYVVRVFRIGFSRDSSLNISQNAKH